MEHYRSVVNGSNLPESVKKALINKLPITLDELDEAYGEFIHMMEHAEYYNVLDRIEKGYEWIAQQTDEQQIERGKARIQTLSYELERLTP